MPKEILKKKRAQLDAVAAALVEKETLTGDEYLMILQG